jgi:two-component system sensor histidine kinase KdpD
MRLVESLGGEPVTLRGDDAAIETIRYARKRNATKLVLGKPTHSRWLDLVKRSFLETVVRQSGEIDVFVISGSPHNGSPAAVHRDDANALPSPSSGYVAGVVSVSAATVASWFFFRTLGLADIVMTYLLGVVVVSMRFGFTPSLVAAVLSVVALDFFFIPPYFSFAVSDLRHVVTFGVMLGVAVVISHLTRRIREQADSARGRERRTASLYAVSRVLGLAQSREALLDAAAEHVRDVFGVRLAVLMPDKTDKLAIVLADDDTFGGEGKDFGVAEWTWMHQRAAGVGTDTLPSSRALVVPLTGSRGRVGVLALFPSDASRLADPDERQLLDTFAGLIGSSLERTELAEDARLTRLRMETEQLRNALLSSVSHDLRTPLAVVTGATSALLEAGAPTDEATRRELLETAHGEALRLNRLVGNLLDMTRLEAGALKVKKDLQPVEEVIGAALNRLEDRLRGRDVHTTIPIDLPLVAFDSALIEQVLINLVENATKYSPAGSPLDVTARASASEVEIEVADRGPGIAKSDEERVFDKFYRVREGEGGGVGLGLTICRGIVTAHGGRIWVDERPGGGSSFRFTLPLDTAAESPPPLPTMETDAP